MKIYIKRVLSRLLKSDLRRLVPDHVFGAENMDQHQHIDRIDASVNAAAIYRPYIISRPPIERQFNADLVKIIRYIRHSSARSAICRKEIEQPAKTLLLKLSAIFCSECKL